MMLAALGDDCGAIYHSSHLSKPSQLSQHDKMPEADHSLSPGGLIVEIHPPQRADRGELKAEPLFTRAGRSHIALHREYGDETSGAWRPASHPN